MSPRLKAKRGRFGSGGLAPVVSIGDAVVVGAGSPATYTMDISGTAIDDQGGDISASIVWTSDLDGALGTGASLSGVSVSAGTHVITAEASDTGSPVNTGSTTKTVVVG